MTLKRVVELLNQSTQILKRNPWRSYKAANPIESSRVRSFVVAVMDGKTPALPDVGTRMGQAIVGLFAILRGAILVVQEPEPTPTPEPVKSYERGAIVVTPGNCDPNQLKVAKVSLVAVEHEKRADLFTSKWDGMSRGLFFVCRAFTLQGAKDEADAIARMMFEAPYEHAIIDTEVHKADSRTPDGSIDPSMLLLTDWLYSRLRVLMPTTELRNITYGVHQNRSVVNHDALDRHKIIDVWEGYEGAAPSNGNVDGASTGVERTASYLISLGHNPVNLMIGDKNVDRDVEELKRAEVRKMVGEIWSWAPEQTGGKIMRLAEVA